MPEDVKDVFGHAIDLAQAGGKHQDAKVMTGFGSAGVLEVVEDDRGDTYRAVYAVKFAGWVYVLHCFQKKSKSGIKTPERGHGPDPRPTQGREAGLRRGWHTTNTQIGTR